MSTPQADYTVVTQVHSSKWFPALNQAVPGWTINVHDSVTGTIVPVFVDDDHYTVAGVEQMIEAALAPIRAVAKLGGQAAPPPASG